MTIFVTSRDFNQDSGSAKRAALRDTVVITERGRPSHVMMSYEAYQQLTVRGRSLAEILAQKDLPEVDDFEPVLMDGFTIRPADFSDDAQ